jgi:hypothetical protein
LRAGLIGPTRFSVFQVSPPGAALAPEKPAKWADFRLTREGFGRCFGAVAAAERLQLAPGRSKFLSWPHSFAEPQGRKR